jgi:nanoRNase/pAp phosphatase (c-di-AMP/oligoRNAs hydrolase)
VDFSTPEGRIEQLHEALSDGDGPVLVLVHDYPDPDCLASALGAKHLLEMWGFTATIAHGRGLGRPENKAMAGLLNLELALLDEIDPEAFRGALLLDTQPGAGNNSLPECVPVRAVVDHHPEKDGGLENVPFVDLRLTTGATSTIVLEYLDTAGAEVDARLATALYLGIKTDTDSLERDASPADVAAYVRLLPDVDLPTVRKVNHVPLTEEYFGLLRRAIGNATRQGEALVANVGAVSQPDLLSAVSDILIDSKETAWALALGWNEGRVYLSLRIRPPRKNAGNLMRRTVEGLGSGGGHALSAGGQIGLPDGDADAVATAAIGRFLDSVGVTDEAPRPLCPREIPAAESE